MVRRLLSPSRSTPDLSRNRKSKVLAQHFSGKRVYSGNGAQSCDQKTVEGRIGRGFGVANHWLCARPATPRVTGVSYFACNDSRYLFRLEIRRSVWDSDALMSIPRNTGPQMGISWSPCATSCS